VAAQRQHPKQQAKAEQVMQMITLNSSALPRAVQAAACLIIAGGLSACGSSEPAQTTAARPDGVYIVQDGKVGRLNEDSQKILQTWEQRTNLASHVQFLVVDPSVAARQPDADAIVLQRVSKVRNVVQANGKAKPSKKPEWVVANLPEERIPVTVVRDSTASHQLRVTANEPLTPGLYAITYNTGRERIGGRFGVGWTAADKVRYASLHCVDRYAGNPASYRPCNQFASVEPAATRSAAKQPVAAAVTPSRIIEIYGLRVEKQIVGGKPLLVLQGSMKNTTASKQPVPLLLAVITDKQGRELTRWPFKPLVDQLPAGGSASFQTSTDAPPKGTANIAVLTEDDLKPRQDAESNSTDPGFIQAEQLPQP
jgi:hypothetical protein